MRDYISQGWIKCNFLEGFEIRSRKTGKDSVTIGVRRCGTWDSHVIWILKVLQDRSRLRPRSDFKRASGIKVHIENGPNMCKRAFWAQTGSVNSCGYFGITGPIGLAEIK